MNNKIKNIIKFSLAATVALTITACNDENAEMPAQPFSCIQGSLISGECSSDLTLNKRNSPFFLTGNKIKIKNNSTLTIEPGVKIYADNNSYLIVTKGSKILALGSEQDPIYFSSINEYYGANPGIGQWGGLVILGDAKTNAKPNNRFVIDETDPDFAFGGNNDLDNSGVLQNIYINNAGYAVDDSGDFDINALSLAGIGSGTTISNVTILNSGDDGIQLWGGTVNLSNLYIENATDDALDVENGYRGTIDGVTILDHIEGRTGIEISNDAAVDTLYPEIKTNFTLKNFTMDFSNLHSEQGAIHFRDKGAGGHFENGVVNFSNSLSVEGAIFNKKGVETNSTTFTNITINDTTGRDIFNGGTFDVDGNLVETQDVVDGITELKNQFYTIGTGNSINP